MSTTTAPVHPGEREDVVVLEHLGMRYDGPIVLDDVNLRVQEGEFVALLGASGCGKSTLLNLIAGLEHPTAGALEMPVEGVGFMFQDSTLYPWLSARRNIELALRFAGVARDERRDRAMELLSIVQLQDSAEKRPHELSGGMRQRVALARALAQNKQVLLMDEPFAALDAITRDLLHDELESVWRQTGRTIIFVTHNVREAVRLGQRVVLLSSRPGRVLREWNLATEVKTPERRARLATEITTELREEIRRHV